LFFCFFFVCLSSFYFIQKKPNKIFSIWFMQSNGKPFHVLILIRSRKKKRRTKKLESYSIQIVYSSLCKEFISTNSAIIGIESYFNQTRYSFYSFSKLNFLFYFLLFINLNCKIQLDYFKFFIIFIYS